MTPPEFIELLREKSHTIRLEGEKLFFVAAPGTPDKLKQIILRELRRQKQEVIAYLVSGERKTREEIKQEVMNL